MALFGLIISMIVIGVIQWLANVYIPMNAAVRIILNAVVVVAIILYGLRTLGII